MPGLRSLDCDYLQQIIRKHQAIAGVIFPETQHLEIGNAQCPWKKGPLIVVFIKDLPQFQAGLLK